MALPPSGGEVGPTPPPEVDCGAAFEPPAYSAAPSAGPPIEVNYYGGPITIQAPPDAGAQELVDTLVDRLRTEIERDLNDAIRRGLSEGRYRLIDDS